MWYTSGVIQKSQSSVFTGLRKPKQTNSGYGKKPPGHLIHSVFISGRTEFLICSFQVNVIAKPVICTEHYLLYFYLNGWLLLLSVHLLYVLGLDSQLHLNTSFSFPVTRSLLPTFRPPPIPLISSSACVPSLPCFPVSRQICWALRILSAWAGLTSNAISCKQHSN